jgi:hypothetical protein
MTGVTALLYHNMKLYAGGNFSSPAHIAQWDGTTWSGLGAGINSNVYSITTDGTNIYAAGEFTMAGGSSAIRIAKWDGANWSALSTGIKTLVEGFREAGVYSVRYSAEGLASGIYFYNLEAGGSRLTGKMLLLR